MVSECVIIERTWSKDRNNVRPLSTPLYTIWVDELVEKEIERLKALQGEKSTDHIGWTTDNIEAFKEWQENPDVFMLHEEHFFETNPVYGKPLGIVVWVIIHRRDKRMGGSRTWLEARCQGAPRDTMAVKEWETWIISVDDKYKSVAESKMEIERQRKEEEKSKEV
jgi:hypothetical protein